MGCATALCSDPLEASVGQELPLPQEASPKASNSADLTLFSTQEPYNDTVKALRRTVRQWLKPKGSTAALVLELWISEVYRDLARQMDMPADLKTRVEVSTHGHLKITHSVDGLRDFTCIEQFCEGLTTMGVRACSRARSHLDFLSTLSALTVSVYLVLGPQIDCGVGVERPLSQSQLAQLLEGCKAGESLEQWVRANNSPIPTACQLSCVAETRTVSFYLFDNHKVFNFSKGFNLFEAFGTAVLPEYRKALLQSNTEEVLCTLTVDSDAVTGVSLEVYDASQAGVLLHLLEAEPAQLHWFSRQTHLTGVALHFSSEAFAVSLFNQV